MANQSNTVGKRIRAEDDKQRDEERLHGFLRCQGDASVELRGIISPWARTWAKARGLSPTASHSAGPGDHLEDDLLRAIDGWHPIDESGRVEYLEGVYKLELDYCGALKDWIHSFLTNTGGELITLEGFFVSDMEGSIWQIMEVMPESSYMRPDGEKRTIKASYIPSGTFPNRAELVIQREHIEAFEDSLKGSQEDRVGPKAATSYRNIIAALLSVIAEGVVSGESPSGRIGPASGFTSEAKLIAALSQHFDGYAGLSKSNLERKFPEARRSLEEF